MNNIIFIAPPAAGKGTQSALLEDRYGYKHISTGDLLRAEIKKGNELGTRIDEMISRGELVSDDIITELLRNELELLKDDKFILDGYPRNITQAETLTDIFDELGIDNYTCVYIDIDQDLAMKRALGRIVCPKCGASYNKYFQDVMPKEEGICDRCGAALEERADDNEETFKKRFETYITSTSPLLDYYTEANKLEKVLSGDNAEETFESIVNVLGSEDVDN